MGHIQPFQLNVVQTVRFGKHTLSGWAFVLRFPHFPQMPFIHLPRCQPLC